MDGVIVFVGLVNIHVCYCSAIDEIPVRPIVNHINTTYSDGGKIHIRNTMHGCICMENRSGIVYRHSNSSSGSGSTFFNGRGRSYRINTPISHGSIADSLSLPIVCAIVWEGPCVGYVTIAASCSAQVDGLTITNSNRIQVRKRDGRGNDCDIEGGGVCTAVAVGHRHGIRSGLGHSSGVT